MSDKIDIDVKKLLGLDDTPVMLQNSEVQESRVVPSSISREPATQTTIDPITQTYQPLSSKPIEFNKGYVAPVIQIPKATDNTEAIKELDQKLIDLQNNYQKELSDAEDRKFKSQIFATIGNYLPAAVAGATAMNTKASVKPADMPKIEASDPTSRVDKKYQTDYEGLLQRYKTLKDGQITPEKLLYANIAQAQLNAGNNRINNQSTISEKNLNFRQQVDDRKAMDRFQQESENAIKMARASEGWKTAEKTLSGMPQVRGLLQEAKKGNGQALSQLGAQMARTVATEVGTMTDADRKVYLENPTILGKSADTFNRYINGKISMDSAENIESIINMVEDLARAKQKAALMREAQSFSKRQSIPIEDAMYMIDTEYSDPKRVGHATKEYAINPVKGLDKDQEQKSNEVERTTKDGRTAIFDATTKKFLRYK